jgi:hypothetical protein
LWGAGAAGASRSGHDDGAPQLTLGGSDDSDEDEGATAEEPRRGVALTVAAAGTGISFGGAGGACSTARSIYELSSEGGEHAGCSTLFSDDDDDAVTGLEEEVERVGDDDEDGGGGGGYDSDGCPRPRETPRPVLFTNGFEVFHGDAEVSRTMARKLEEAAAAQPAAAAAAAAASAAAGDRPPSARGVSRLRSSTSMSNIAAVESLRRTASGRWMPAPPTDAGPAFRGGRSASGVEHF